MPIDDVVIVDLDENQLESPYLSMDLEGFPASLVSVVFVRMCVLCMYLRMCVVCVHVCCMHTCSCVCMFVCFSCECI